MQMKKIGLLKIAFAFSIAAALSVFYGCGGGLGDTGSPTGGTIATSTGTSTGTPTSTGTGGGGTKPGTLEICTGYLATGYFDGYTRTVYDGDLYQNYAPGEHSMNGFAKIDLSGIPTSARISGGVLHFTCTDTTTPKGSFSSSTDDPQAGANRLLDTDYVWWTTSGYELAPGQNTWQINSEGVNAINAAIASGKGFILVVWHGC
jgi:hypothetical protein